MGHPPDCNRRPVVVTGPPPMQHPEQMLQTLTDIRIRAEVAAHDV